jgi:3-deoxy-manno-octulosonate cytidylyltransferase (CMP-KDO synthetase)
MYVYRRDFLLKFASMPATFLEISEKLEQLRALENGIKIRVVETEFESIGVDTPDDLLKAREQYRKLHT